MSDEPELDWDKIDEVALALLWLGRWDDDPVTRVWKGLAWEITDHLYEKGWIDNPRSKNKSVIMTAEGVEKAKEMLRKHFAR